MYIDLIIGSERATRRKSRNSVSNRDEVTIDNILCLCNSFMAAVPRAGSRELTKTGVVAPNEEEER